MAPPGEGRRAEPAEGAVESRCLNCGTALRGPFCFRCGQKAEPRPMPLGHFAVEAFEEVFSLDRRFLRTVGRLLARPGQLTRDWLDGFRVRFVPPFRLYLTLSVVYFVVLAVSKNPSFFFFTASARGEEAAEFIRLLPKLMFFILPAFGLLLRAVYPRAWGGYVAHLVFALHFHAFAFFLLSAHTLLEAGVLAALARGALVPARIGMVVDSALQLALFVWLYLALRRVYGRGRIVTALLSVALMAGYLGLLVLAASGIFRLEDLLRARF